MGKSQQVFCVKCGKQIQTDTVFCASCGANQIQQPAINSVQKPNDPLPDGIRGWSWGAFWLNFIWAIFNKTWIGLLTLIPVVNLVMMVVLGLKGREWAWRNKEWSSVGEFNRVQKKWNIAGWALVAISLVAGFTSAFLEDRMTSNKQAPIGTSDIESDKNMLKIEPPPAMVLKPSNINSPYPQAQIIFSKIDFLSALKKLDVETFWESEFILYLNDPQTYWKECVEKDASFAQLHGNMNPTESLAHAEKSCQDTTTKYYQCLNNSTLEDAVMCLKQHVNDIAENGE